MSLRPHDQRGSSPGEPGCLPEKTEGDTSAASREGLPSDSAIEVGDDSDSQDLYTENSEDGDGYESEAGSTYTASLSSSVKGHTYDGGLRYHAFHEGKYAFPNDENEQNRDDMKHAMTLLLCDGKLHYAPLGDNPQDMIDLGTGTGIWAIEMADKYPSAIVLGVDLSPIQPTWVPPNTKFLVDDVEDKWLYPDNHFDYVHARHVVHSIKDHMLLISRAYRHLKPGAYLEFQELVYYPYSDDESLTEPYVFKQFMEGIRDGMASLGNDLNGANRLRAEMEAAGFVNVTEHLLRCPVGIWPKDKTLKLAGLYWRTAIMDGLKGLAHRSMGTGLGWSQEKIDVFLVDVRRSLMDTSKHAYFPLHIVYGQKPLE